MNHVDNEQLSREQYELMYNRPPLRSEQNVPLKTNFCYSGNVPPINLSLTSRVAYDRAAALEAQVLALQSEQRDMAVALLKARVATLEAQVADLQCLLDAKRRECAALQDCLAPKMEQKPSTGDLLARASSFDRPLDAYAR